MTNNKVNSRIPQPNYDKDVDKIVKVYQSALRDIQAEMTDVLLDDFRRGMLASYEAQLRAIISELDGKAIAMTTELIEKAATNGIADTLMALGYAETYKQAQAMATFGALNKPFIDAVIMDTQTDLLAITANTERKTRQVVRQAIADAMRETYAKGGGKGADLTREALKKLKDEANLAIIDAAGRKWKLETYVKMAVHTKSMHAHRQAAINEGIEDGAYYGIISSHNAKDACRHYEGKIVKLTDSADGDYQFIGDIPRSSLFHPFCKHLVTPIRNPERYE